MAGKFIAYVLSLLTFFYIFLMSISFFMYMATNERINDICYDAAETISTKGILSAEICSYVKSNIACYGEYDISLILEKNSEENSSVFYYGEDQICDMPLSRGDRVIISVEDRNPSFFEKISGKDMRVSTVKVAIVN